MINQQEYEKLKEAKSDGYEWVARDESGWVYVYKTKPEKCSCSWADDNDEKALSSHGSAFEVLSWHDEEPYSIVELIEEYENENGMRYDFGKIKVVDIDTSKLAISNDYFHVKESEETEVNKQELIEKWETAIESAEFYGKGKEDRLISYMRDFVDDLKQLDEAEPKNITREETQNDPVHSPSHYKQGHIETIDKIKLLLTPEEYLGYLKGNIIKYGDRAPFKGNMEQDYDKQKVYYDWALKDLGDVAKENSNE